MSETSLVTLASNFSENVVKREAARCERQCRISEELLNGLRSSRLLGAAVNAEFGGIFSSYAELGLICKELARYSTSVRNLITAHYMVSQGLQKWGSKTIKQEVLPSLANGEKLGAFCLTEVQSGSDFDRIESTIKIEEDSIILNGKKSLVSIGCIADYFLVFAKHNGQHGVVLVPRETPGVIVEPEVGATIGARASLLGRISFESVRLSKNNLIGPLGFGKIGVGLFCLNLGRFTIAWGCIGTAEACLKEVSLRLSSTKRFKIFLSEQLLVQKEMASLGIALETATYFCSKAAREMDANHPDALLTNSYAKYTASKALSQISQSCTRLSGAVGVLEDSIVGRAYRDAPIIEMIEGASEIHESIIGQDVINKYGKKIT